MSLKSILIAPSAGFWPGAARALLAACRERSGNANQRDFADWRVVLPTFAHAQQLKAALNAELGGTFVPPQFFTLSGWLMTLPPQQNVMPASERLMRLYAELRQHGWLKKLFTARRNTDLLPLAQTLLALSDELTQAMLPSLHAADGDTADLEQRWQHALEQLSPDARKILSDETQLVWSIWKSQLDADDAIASRFAQTLQMAEQASQPMAWISSVAPEPLEQAFLDAYAARQPVLTITLDWRAPALLPTYAVAWPEMVETAVDDGSYAGAPSDRQIDDWTLSTELTLCAAQSVEDEAVQGAQMVIDWLQAGKSSLAIVAQDRVVARRIRALLERAQIHVADETGWKLSTTRAASAISAWFDVVTARGETTALLDLLKSPFVLNEAPSDLLHDAQDSVANKSALVMKIELLLRRANVLGEWRNVINALSAAPAEQNTVSLLAQQAAQFGGRKTLRDWIATTSGTLDALGISSALGADSAGQQILQLLQNIAPSGNHSGQDYAALFSFPEWRALVNLQLDDTSFISAINDRRVVMLPLNGARLRTFDAVLVVGADADHLPSQPQETLFFANTVRRELGLATRESRQRQQLRDVVELLAMNPQVVLSWQAHKDGEPNPVSPWIQRLQLTLARHGAAALPEMRATIAAQSLQPTPSVMPVPAAAQLTPTRLTASAYNSFIACPYQFFARRMLGLASLDELSDLPEKRDYGGWLHEILETYHETLRDQPCPPERREALLVDISKKLFDSVIARNPAALGYYARWQKVIAAYVVWANEHEALGWRFVFGEQAYEKPLPLPDRELTLHGRIDRIDENDAGERAVLDYKTNNLVALNKKLKDHEDHQLAFYGLLSDRPVAAAHYVALETTKDKVGDVSAPDYDEAQRALATQITINVQAIASGVGLPANGTESVCQYCDVRGLCRKGAW
ncbi:PD-(D/E)XK nuclease superfamily protein [Collimonas arenae]|uniref:PD-(D/E)XK nuclease superfamily protein n=1 Tax=Collimonas arenae TaxID=279058 RepID=A0A127QGB9_9BURK|nr:PD-(D/E)XK nuclease family protein [Collimonas arenae]AMO98769.1 PD-(D/E)XK nuclease superfamily protein [Collimonas arenae]AMP08662.1 PD-(D/E)XK nuclease superfamily protein [Collimonas arenae]